MFVYIALICIAKPLPLTPMDCWPLVAADSHSGAERALAKHCSGDTKCLENSMVYRLRLEVAHSEDN